MKNRKTWFIIGGSLLLVLIFSLVFQNAVSSRYSWEENYKRSGKQPYNVSIVHDLLKSYFPGQNFDDQKTRPRKWLSQWLGVSGGNYIFLGEYPYYNQADVDSLVSFVSAGGRALIIGKSFPAELDTFVAGCGSFMPGGWVASAVMDSAVCLQLAGEVVPDAFVDTVFYRPKGKTNIYQWSSIDSLLASADSCKVEPLGSFRSGGTESANFLRLQLGEGELLVHTTPLAFTDVHMLGERALVYASGVFSYLQPGDIFWDVASQKRPPPPNSPEEAEEENGGRGFEESPLKYLLAQNELRWAWYLLLGLGLLFMLFRSKRRQRIIPVILPPRNTSLAFVESVGRLYFQQNDDRRLMQRKMKLFLYHLRTRYQIEVREDDLGATGKIALRSGVAEDKIRDIFTHFNRFNSFTAIDKGQLIVFHQAVDYFYKNAA